MATVAQIQKQIQQIQEAITQLCPAQAQQLREWLEQWLEDQQPMTPQFIASIEQGKRDLSNGQTRIISHLRTDADPRAD